MGVHSPGRLHPSLHAHTFAPPSREHDRRPPTYAEKLRKVEEKRRKFEREDGITFAPAISERSVRIAETLPTSARDRLFAPRRPQVPAQETEDTECLFRPRIDRRSEVLATHLKRENLWKRLHISADEKIVKVEKYERQRAQNELRGCTFHPLLTANDTSEKLRGRLRESHATVDEYFATRRSHWEQRQQAWQDRRQASVEERREEQARETAEACPFRPRVRRKEAPARPDSAMESKGEKAFLLRQREGRELRERYRSATELRCMTRSQSAPRAGRVVAEPASWETGRFVSNFDRLQESRLSSRGTTPRKEAVFRGLRESLREELREANLD